MSSTSHHEILEFGAHARIDMPTSCDCNECSTLQSLLESHKKKQQPEQQQYDIAFCASNLPFEMAFTHSHSKQVTTIQQNKLVKWSDYDIKNATNVLIIGSYYDVDNIAELRNISSCVTHYVMSNADLKKFPDARSFEDEAFSNSSLWKPSWLYALYARTSKDATDDDRAFYRGLMHTYHGMPWDIIVKENIDTQKTINIGHIILNHITNEAFNMVDDHSRDIRCGPYQARMVVNPCQMYVTDIVRIACGMEYDIGIMLRYDFLKKITKLSFYTNKSYVDLSFLHEKPYDAGGNDIKGITISHIIPYSDNIQTIEEFLTK